MSIPKDPLFVEDENIDKSVIATTDENINPSTIQDGAELQDDGTEYRPTDEHPGGEVQLASLNNLYRKGSKVVSDVAGGVNEFLTKESKKDTVANVNKPKGEKAGTIQKDDLAVTDESGAVFIRPLKAEEVEDLVSFVVKEDPDFKDIDLSLLNLGNFETGFKETGDLDLTLKRLMKKIYDEYKDATIDGKAIRVEPSKVTEVVEVNGTKKFIREGGVTFEMMLKEAEKIGAHQSIINMLTRKPGDRPFSYAELLAARKTALSFEILIYRQIKKYEKSGALVDLAKLQQSIGLYAYATLNLAGNTSDLGRAMVSQKIAANPSNSHINSLGNVVDQHASGIKPGQDPVATMIGGKGTFEINDANVHRYIEANGGEAQVKLLVDRFMMLPRNGARTRFAQGWLRSKLGMGANALVELYQTSLLSSITTHSFNAAGQMAFMSLVPFERMLSGEVREGLLMYKAMAKYFPQAIKGMTYALINEKSMSDSVSKLDVNSRSISGTGFGLQKKGFKDLGSGMETGTSYALDFFGVAMRMAGYRPMLAIDEFFKATSRGMEMEALAFRSKRDTIASIVEGYDADPKNFSYLDKDGKTKTFTNREEAVTYAKEQGQVSYIHTLNSADTYNEASDFARMITFQDELPEAFSQIGKFINHPIAKIWIPFYKTPTQIVRRIVERSGPFAFIMPSVREKILHGNARERKEAITKATGLTSIFAIGMGISAGVNNDSVTITGYGPTDPKKRETWLQHHKPYSIGVQKDDGTWDWISYARYDPISGVLGMMADAKDVVKYMDSPDDILDIMIGGAFASMKYVGTALPMMQFLGELGDVIQAPYESNDQLIERIGELLTKQVASAGLTVTEHIKAFGVYTPPAIQGNIERVQHPLASNTLPGDQYTSNYMVGQGIERAWYTALNKHCSRQIGCSSKLPTLKNRWYEEIKQTEGSGWNYWSPIKIINLPGKTELNKELEIIGYGFPRLSHRVFGKGILLNNEQYDRFLELYNYPERSEFSKDAFRKGALPGTGGVPMGILNEMNLLINSDTYKTMPDPANPSQRVPANKGHKADLLDSVHSKYLGYAKKLLMFEYPELTAIELQIDSYRNENLKNPTTVINPNPNEVEDANKQNMQELFGN